jgi:heterodisulfide reductase subunit A-like polyferredoxin
MSTPDVFASRSRASLQLYHERHKDELKLLDLDKMLSHHKLVQPTLQTPSPHQAIKKDKPVCIVGAGVAGLYTAMILKSLGIPYDILELSDHVGGIA